MPLRSVPLGPVDVALTRRPDGTVLVRTRQPLAPYPERLTERLLHWAREAPDRVFIAQRDASGGWRTLTYGLALELARAAGQALIDRGLTPERPLAILSGNDIEHAVLALAALHAGVPYAPLSPAYSLLSQDFGKLRQIMQVLRPGLVYASQRERYSKAIAATLPPGVEIADFVQLADTRPRDAVEKAHAAIRPDGIAKLLFTSGSTGRPKGVINTHRMLCANQQMLAQGVPFLCAVRPILVDWLPWHHTAGGNHNFGLTLYHGGTLYIDEGKPLPGLIDTTVRNLREVGPTIYFNVPRGYEALLPYLRADETLRKSFFGRLGLLQYAAAVLPQPVWKAYQELAAATCGESIHWITGYGATETAPFALGTHGGARRAGSLGVPADGLEMKLAPVNEKLEARFRGPSIAPGYWREPQLTREAFDDEGFYRSGDALRFVEPDDASQGFEFDGRIAEDFKLSTGTWASCGPLRAHFIAAAAPYVQDIVLTGHDRDWIGALVFPNAEACRKLADPRAWFGALLARLAREAGGSSHRIERMLILEAPPSIDAGEITDKGSINQRAVLERRAALVEALYAEPPPPEVITAGART
jgi:feruloyl-CoA synthase